MAISLLVARGFCYSYPYGGIVTLHNLNLTIKKVRRLAILGSNGSGKTTLLLHLNGTFWPTQGEVLLDGCPVTYDRHALDRWRARLG